MKKTLRIVFLLLFIGIGIWYVYVQKTTWKTSDASAQDFSISDTASIAQLFIADQRGHFVNLKRNADASWMVNDSFEADQAKIQLVLQTLKDMQVARPVSESEHNRVIALLSTEGKKVEIYNASGTKMKTFYVGPGTADNTGTYMIHEGAAQAYVLHIPGFVGYLTPRFFTDALIWRSKLVFDANANDITEIDVQYPGNKQDGFSIRDGKVWDENGAEIVCSAQAIAFYKAGFRQLYMEGYKSELEVSIRDSIRAMQPYCTIRVKTVNGKWRQLALHQKKTDQATMQQFDEKGNPIMIDRERYYGFIDNEPYLCMVQQFNFGRIIKTRKDLQRK